jgi:5-methylcytosine-specific restriction endonuclease McrA
VADKTCQVCRNRVDPEDIKVHHIVPKNLTDEAGIPESQTIQLCTDCHQEVHAWYTARVRSTEYDDNIRRFRHKSSLEMISEYQKVFSDFIKYKGAH